MKVTLNPGERWATVSRDDDWATARYRHVTSPGYPTSVCGVTALPASLWRGDTRKPQCPVCVAAMAV